MFQNPAQSKSLQLELQIRCHPLVGGHDCKSCTLICNSKFATAVMSLAYTNVSSSLITIIHESFIYC